MSSDLGASSEEEGCIEPGDGDGGQLDREQHAAHDGLRRRRGQEEMDAEKFRRLGRRGFPGRKQDREEQRRHHPVEDVEAQLFRHRRGGAIRRGARCAETVPALRAEPIDLRQRLLAGWAGLHNGHNTVDVLA